MNRRALLIGASPEGDPLKFVATDIQAWTDFLLSPEGGAWSEDEITDASSMRKDNLLAETQVAKELDYSIVVFAGHGCTVKTDLPWTELQLYLCSGETVLERELNSGSARCCLIFDCCRTKGENEKPVLEEYKIGSVKNAYMAVRSREIYWNALQQTEKGLVKIYSTGDNTAAADKHSFSQHLIHVASDWASQSRGILQMDRAVELCAKSLSHTHPQQIPEYQGGRRLHHFPFALSP